jgi:hypothetical protein
MERQSKESRGLEAYCRGGQDPPQAVAPFGRKEELTLVSMPPDTHDIHNIRSARHSLQST